MCLAGAHLEELYRNSIYICIGGAYEARRKSKMNHGPTANDRFSIGNTQDAQTEVNSHNTHSKYLFTATAILWLSFLGHLEWRIIVSK